MKRQKIAVCVFSVALLCSVILSLSNEAFAFTLPDTGQTKCYDTAGIEISCTGTGQDGAYNINPMSFTDNGDGTITDNVTGLMWQKGENATRYNWYRASGTYDATNNPSSQNVCGSLTLGGQSGWRIPTEKELISIVDYSIPSPVPAINTTYFPNTYADGYWSSTTVAYGTITAWNVYFNDGGVSYSSKSNGYYVRCVRGGQSQTVTLFNAGNYLYGITAGSDGNLWFTESVDNRIGRITPAGVVTEFSAGISAGAFPSSITAGSDGNLWFTESLVNRIGRITPTGVVTEFSAGITANAGIDRITAGPDGNLWFTEFSGNRIGRITPTGVVTEFSAGISAGAYPSSITSGADGNLWFIESADNRIGRITPAGVVTEFSAGITTNAVLFGITGGPDGNLWFTEFRGNRIGRITIAGVVTEFSAGISDFDHSMVTGDLGDITTGPDGNLWFIEAYNRKIGRITPTGVVTEFNPGMSGPLGDITAGPDGNVWFTSSAGYGYDKQIGRITTGQVFPFFTNNGNGTITDNVTGLIWQQGEPGIKTWADALTYCEGLSLRGQTDWRLPNIKELESIVDETKYSPAINTTYFPNTYADGYWSSTTVASYTSNAWGVYFGVGYGAYSYKSSGNYVRCVRGGQ